MAETMWFRKMLAEHVATDPTRVVLTSVHYDAEGWFVATNGQRMLCVREKLLALGPKNTPEAGSGYHGQALVGGQLFKRVEGVAFPDWRKIVAPPPTELRAIWRLRPPEWLAIRPKRPTVRACALVGGSHPGLRLGFGTGQNVLAAVDLRYLRPYALLGSVCVGIRGEREPILFAETPEAVKNPLGASWFGVVMGLKMDAHDDVVVPIEIATMPAAK